MDMAGASYQYHPFIITPVTPVHILCTPTPKGIQDQVTNFWVSFAILHLQQYRATLNFNAMQSTIKSPSDFADSSVHKQIHIRTKVNATTIIWIYSIVRPTYFSLIERESFVHIVLECLGA